MNGDTSETRSEIRFEQVMAAGDISVLVVDDNPVNCTMALSFLRNHNIKAETALSGAQALVMIENKARNESAYDLVFMDHLMPEMDGAETTKRIRQWENETGRGKQTQIIALSANTETGAQQLFLQAGMNDFIPKPITTEDLNRVLQQWLPADKLRFAEVSAGLVDHSKDPLLEELSGIKGLDVEAGLANAGHSRESYFLALRQFTENCDSYTEGLIAAGNVEAWGDYTIKVHALKGVLAAFGLQRLAQWASNLEKASKICKDIPLGASPSQGDISFRICREETAPFCRNLSAFRDKLRLTSLFSSPDTEEKEKPKGDKNFLLEKLGLLRKACAECSFEDTEKAIAALGGYKWSDETDAALEKVRVLVLSYDYEEALEKLNTIS